ncbi:MAG TPA: nicotinate (nicotinamide) nucleotide adenylyltransferase [Candidatus Mailhella merdigallinarum]|uniref:Probable nicotinate-nucleotide adenylyltransferase n=1 Tax=Candidatus Mailhella merdigallinarum TaxID=2838658 RepID=A0A9D2KLE0_9BACT|nr:nicotinate (nicotinamide) nucleotide adenylyltransferase [Desulfovibrionaceae bacterium]HJA08656.1 nicotinate (nicotinamide) nucleotide adenylyltransferase [Candidatus Mailhella merdigallinarum]
MEDHRFLPAPGARVGLLGGTFNPVHAGHIRHALEVGEALNLERVLLTPAAVPPHKAAAGLLPFALRVELARAAARGASRLGVNTLEGELDGPSYTFVSLRAWRERHPGVTPFFLMGVEDFAALRSWHRGLELPELARLVVVPRAGSDRGLFHAALERYWPGASAGAERADGSGRESVRLPDGGVCDFLPVPRLDISSSFVRERWLAGRDIRALVPDGVLDLMEARREEIRRAWTV